MYLGAILSYEAHSSLRLLGDLRKWNSCYHLVCGILLAFAGWSLYLRYNCCVRLPEGQEQYIPIIDFPKVSFWRDRRSRVASKREEGWYTEELRKSGMHCTVEAPGWKRFEDVISLSTISPQSRCITTIHHNSECSAEHRQNSEDLKLLALGQPAHQGQWWTTVEMVKSQASTWSSRHTSTFIQDSIT